MKSTIKNIGNKLRIKFALSLLMINVVLIIVCLGTFSFIPKEGNGQDKSGTVTIVTEDEPGKKLIIKGKVLLPDGSPVAGARIRVFQTDAEGYYKKSGNGSDLGWRESRISEVFSAGSEGEFEIHTIRPAGYPDTPAPEHIHFRISTPNLDEQEHTIYFTDDEKVTESFRNRIQRDARFYLVKLRKNDEILIGEFNLVFDL